MRVSLFQQYYIFEKYYSNIQKSIVTFFLLYFTLALRKSSFARFVLEKQKQKCFIKTTNKRNNNKFLLFFALLKLVSLRQRCLMNIWFYVLLSYSSKVRRFFIKLKKLLIHNFSLCFLTGFLRFFTIQILGFLSQARNIFSINKNKLDFQICLQLILFGLKKEYHCNT